MLGATQLCFGGLAVPSVVYGFAAPELAPVVQLGRSAIVGIVFIGLSTVFGLMSIVVAAGLAVDRKWAWYLGMFLGFAYIPTGCLPIGGALLLVLLEPGCRAYFLWNPDQLYTAGVDEGV